MRQFWHIQKCLVYKERFTPFEYLRHLSYIGQLGLVLRAHRIAPYGSRKKSFEQVCELRDLQNVTMEDLVEIFGISYKTANFFLTHSREDHEFPILDTHILAWLKERGYEVPKSSPSDFKRYMKYANYFLDEAKKLGKNVATLDLEIWNERARTKRR